MTTPDVDVVIVGAGVSGIGIACHLAKDRPATTYALIERREAIGGTWDLFRYPGIRCDSDMNTFGYAFRPWVSDRIITDGDSIREYVTETAAEFGVTEHIRFGQRVTRAWWDSGDGFWTVESVDEATGQPRTITARFAVSCTGYYDYDRGHMPDFPGIEDYRGEVVHPQFWPDELDPTGRDIAVIGSGATAVTLVPALAPDANTVTLLQRSPGYIVSIPEVDPISPSLKRLLPETMVGDLARLRNLAIQQAMYQGCRRFPNLSRWLILEGVRRQVGPDISMRHFTPSYDPWDERLCVVPDGDLFRTLRRGQATIVTDHIDTFTERGIRLQSGEEIVADLVVSATGLEIQMLGGVEAEIDGEKVTASDRLAYKGIMVDGVPNFGLVFGYVNVSWTRKVDLVGTWLTRLLDHMDDIGATRVTPIGGPEFVSEGEPFVTLSSGYLERAADRMPLQGTTGPWRNSNNILLDWLSLNLGSVTDDHLEFASDEGVVDGAPASLRERAGRVFDAGFTTARRVTRGVADVVGTARRLVDSRA